jgi:hypothetical protein
MVEVELTHSGCSHTHCVGGGPWKRNRNMHVLQYPHWNRGTNEKRRTSCRNDAEPSCRYLLSSVCSVLLEEDSRQARVSSATAETNPSIKTFLC